MLKRRGRLSRLEPLIGMPFGPLDISPSFNLNGSLADKITLGQIDRFG
jgi:hypothetical protein